MQSTRIAFTLALALGLAGCKSTPPTQPAPIVDMNNGADPALANLAPVDPNAAPAAQTNYPASTQPTGSVLGYRSEPAQTAPSTEQFSYPQQTNDDAYDQYNAQYDAQANAGQDALYADQAPPPLPVYDQPELTQPNDQWTPGYWNYANAGYYFVPGAWVAPPYSGALWTPGYWGYEGRRYRFHRGFWGRHIGFYGGINYGFGYVGRGYEGGYWNNNTFFYNQRVNRVNAVDVRNLYVRNVTAVNNEHFSYNGPGGYQTRPVAAELAVYREQRLPPQQAQIQIRTQAAGNRQQFFAENHGRPAVFAAPQHFNADANQARPIQPVQRGGFGQPAAANLQQQQRTAQAEQHTAQQQQQTAQRQQQNTQRQQQNTQRQQQNTQRQQQEKQRTQQLQQRNAQQQQRAQQIQQRGQQQQQAGQQTAQQQQRVQAAQQHNAAAQQQNAQRQQQVQAQQQRSQQNVQAQQQRGQQEQQRGQQEQQRAQQEQQRGQQEQQRGQQEQQRAPQAQPQQRAPQPQPQRAAPAPRPQPAAAPAPRPQPAPQQHAEPAHGGEHPRR